MSHFNFKINQCSPVQVDYSRIVNYDEDGNEFITYEEVDYPAIQRANGVVKDWALDALLRAGIDPSFSIHTGNPTRLDGISDLDAMNLYLDSILGVDESSE